MTAKGRMQSIWIKKSPWFMKSEKMESLFIDWYMLGRKRKK